MLRPAAARRCRPGPTSSSAWLARAPPRRGCSSTHGEVIGCDAGAPAEAAGIEGVEVHLRTGGTELVERARTVVKSPGVPASAPPIVAARERGLEVVGELELAWRLVEGEFFGVTGTNGKTTTCELLGAILRSAGAEVAVAGNVGHAARVAGGGGGEPRAVGGVRVLELPARGRPGLRPRVRGAAERRGGPPRPPRHARRLPRGQAAHLRKPGARRRRRAAHRPSPTVGGRRAAMPSS